jgi:catechol 2,3-dioxygenase-like lactoylglutathione lyase family enzyme
VLDGLAIHPSLPASDIARARAWYLEHLGLTPLEEHAGEVLVYGEGAARFAVYHSAHAGTAQNTAAVWAVADLRAVAAQLRDRGVVFEEYDFGEVKTVDGVLEDPEGGLNAWFKDSEGNILGLSQAPPGRSSAT